MYADWCSWRLCLRLCRYKAGTQIQRRFFATTLLPKFPLGVVHKRRPQMMSVFQPPPSRPLLSACDPSRDSKNCGQWLGPIWRAHLGESLVMFTGPSLAPKFIALLGTKFGAHYGKKMFALSAPNFALTVIKFVFSHSGNFRAKANPPKPRSCPKCPFRKWLGPISSADWV